jgi:hypothetical protein
MSTKPTSSSFAFAAELLHGELLNTIGSSATLQNGRKIYVFAGFAPEIELAL